MTKGKTILIPKDENTEDTSKFRPITCLPTVYKIFTSVITQKIYQHIETHNIISEKQKGCRKNSRGCKEQIVIDEVILNQVRKKEHNISIAYIDYQKVYDSVPHAWLTDILRIYKIHPQIIAVLTEAMKKWRTVTLRTPEREITTNEIKIEKVIFQGDALSPLWFCLAVNPLSNLLNDTEYGYKLKSKNRDQHTINHLLYMDDLKVYAQTPRQLKYILGIITTFSGDFNMKLGVSKCKIIETVKGKHKEGQEYPLKEGGTITNMSEN
jgi:hypothetical protein